MAVSADPERELPDLSAEVITRARTLQRSQLSPSIVTQARHFIQVAGLDPDTETLLLNGYGILREKRFPVSVGQEEVAH
jgi:hypothetical protein